MIGLVTMHATADDFLTPYEISQGEETATYWEAISYYQRLAEAYPTLSIKTMGLTDSGEPLHLVLYSASSVFDVNQLKKQNKRILLINNAIHPGEPDGVDACMMFLRDLAAGKWVLEKGDQLVIGVIPIYNIGGALNRNSTTRVNQVGPKSYGFRGNARNYDLNRDYIKNDTLNAQSFAEIFHLLDPDVYLETHVTNGSDHQYVLTLISTQKDKLGGPLGAFLHQDFEPYLMENLSGQGVLSTPYVNVFGSTPDKGFQQFLEGPRYSTGYTALFHTLGFMTETHSLKPFKERVMATRAFIETLARATVEKANAIENVRQKQAAFYQAQESYPVTWELDKKRWRDLDFKGYEPEMLPSKVTSSERLRYNREKPLNKVVPFYDTYVPGLEIMRPRAYVVPRGWHSVVSLLQRNKIEMQQLNEDQILAVEVYYIDSFETAERPYEGHYPHFNTQIRKQREKVTVPKGDWLVSTHQRGIRYLMETLEPQASDSLFSWNYFDTILQQKEYFSGYIFEDIAESLLKENPTLRAEFEDELKRDEAFAKNPRTQLDWIYRRSPHYEKAHLRYPILRVLNQ